MERERPNIVIIIQARMESTRLPGKVLMPVLGKPLLAYLIERVRNVKNADKIIIATTKNSADDEIERFCRAQGLLVFRGSVDDVLARYRDVAILTQANVIVRITGDCPLIDPLVVDKVIQFYLDHSFDYVGNTLTLSYPRGMDTEVFSYKTLLSAFQKASRAEEREHVTLYIYQHPEQFKVANVPYITDKSGYRLTVDTKEDFILVKTIIKKLYPANPKFSLEDILTLLEQDPSLAKINSHIIQKKG